MRLLIIEKKIVLRADAMCKKKTFSYKNFNVEYIKKLKKNKDKNNPILKCNCVLNISCFSNFKNKIFRTR